MSPDGGLDGGQFGIVVQHGGRLAHQRFGGAADHLARGKGPVRVAHEHLGGGQAARLPAPFLGGPAPFLGGPVCLGAQAGLIPHGNQPVVELLQVTFDQVVALLTGSAEPVPDHVIFGMGEFGQGDIAPRVSAGRVERVGQAEPQPAGRRCAGCALSGARRPAR